MCTCYRSKSTGMDPAGYILDDPSWQTPGTLKLQMARVLLSAFVFCRQGTGKVELVHWWHLIGWTFCHAPWPAGAWLALSGMLNSLIHLCGVPGVWAHWCDGGETWDYACECYGFLSVFYFCYEVMVWSFCIAYEDDLFIANIPDPRCNVRDAGYEVCVYFVWCRVGTNDARCFWC